MTSEKTTLAQEITKLVARGILVVNRRHAMAFADNLAEFLRDDYQRPPRDWHVVSIKAFNDAGPLIVDGLEEVERVHEEILDFYDRLAAGYINQESIHLITVNAEAGSAFQRGCPPSRSLETGSRR